MDFSDADYAEYLVHFGVKGMHWGVRKEQSSGTPSSQRAEELRKINKKIGKINGQTAFNGLELRGWALKKQYKKAIRKNPDFKFSKLSPEEKAAWEKKASRKITHTLVRRGVLETSVILAGGGLTLKSGLSPKAKQGAAISSVLLAGQVGKTRISEIHSVKVADKLESLQARRDELTKPKSRTVKIRSAS